MDTDLGLHLLTCCALLASISGHSCGARAQADSKSLARELGFEDEADSVEGTRLHDSAADKLAATDANDDNALKCEREKVRSLLNASGIRVGMGLG